MGRPRNCVLSSCCILPKSKISWCRNNHGPIKPHWRCINSFINWLGIKSRTLKYFKHVTNTLFPAHDSLYYSSRNNKKRTNPVFKLTSSGNSRSHSCFSLSTFFNSCYCRNFFTYSILPLSSYFTTFQYINSNSCITYNTYSRISCYNRV